MNLLDFFIGGGTVLLLVSVIAIGVIATSPKENKPVKQRLKRTA